MPIEVITSKRQTRNFLVYDMEWVPGTLLVRMVGVYDGKRYRRYDTVDEFLDHELSRENYGAWFYAHAGGLADIQFVLESVFKRNGYTVQAHFSGSSAIIVKVSRDGKTWRFVDSYWLLRDSLANIAKSIGMEKGHSVEGFESLSEEKKRAFYTSAPLPELETYNERDCVILWTAIYNFESAIWNWGGMLKMTQASTALELFRRRFLKQDIDTYESVNTYARLAYFASRVEVFAADCEDSFYYDINSSFPYAMMQPCPGNYLGSGKRIPEDGTLYLADCEFEIFDTYLPPIPTRIKNRVFFPTGRWRSWLSNVDVELLLREGNRIHKVYDVHKFDQFNDLAEYVTQIYTHRKNSSDPFVRTVDKLLLNSLYGKFGESSHKTAMHYNPTVRRLKKWELDDAEVEELLPGCWLEHRDSPVKHAHVAISVHITALARRTIFDYMAQCRDMHYCDTDGFSTSEILNQTGNELGMLKMEREIKRGLFVAPKVYRLDDKVKAKGFSLSKAKDSDGVEREAIAQFEGLVSSGKISVTRMTRLRELWRNKSTKPEESVIIKGLTAVTSGKAIHKRHMYPDGESRPWHIDELKEMLL